MSDNFFKSKIPHSKYNNNLNLDSHTDKLKELRKCLGLNVNSVNQKDYNGNFLFTNTNDLSSFSCNSPRRNDSGIQTNFNRNYRKVLDEFYSLGYETDVYSPLRRKSVDWDQKLRLKAVQSHLEEKKKTDFSNKLDELKMNAFSNKAQENNFLKNLNIYKVSSDKVKSRKNLSFSYNFLNGDYTINKENNKNNKENFSNYFYSQTRNNLKVKNSFSEFFIPSLASQTSGTSKFSSSKNIQRIKSNDKINFWKDEYELGNFSNNLLLQNNKNNRYIFSLNNKTYNSDLCTLNYSSNIVKTSNTQRDIYNLLSEKSEEGPDSLKYQPPKINRAKIIYNQNTYEVSGKKNEKKVDFIDQGKRKFIEIDKYSQEIMTKMKKKFPDYVKRKEKIIISSNSENERLVSMKNKIKGLLY